MVHQNAEKVINEKSWAKFQPTLKKIEIITPISHETKKLPRISAKRVEKCIYTCLFPMEPQRGATFRQAFKKP